MLALGNVNVERPRAEDHERDHSQTERISSGSIVYAPSGGPSTPRSPGHAAVPQQRPGRLRQVDVRLLLLVVGRGVLSSVSV